MMSALLHRFRMAKARVSSAIVGSSLLCATASADGRIDWYPPGNPNAVSVSDQCVTFAKLFANAFLNSNWPAIGTYHSDLAAHWIWNDSRLQPTNTTRIANNGSNFPQRWDIIVWNSAVGGGSGHIAIVDAATSRTSVVVAESNWTYPLLGDIRTFSLNSGSGTNVLGWFRPHNQSQPANIWWTSTPPSGRWYRTNERLAYSWSGTNPTVVEWPAVGSLGEIYVADGGLGWRQYGARAYNATGDVTIIWDGGWDDVLPTASQIAGPAPGAWVNGSPSVTWRCSDAHAGVRRFWYRWDGGGWQGPYGGTDGTVPLAEGEHVLETLVEDHAFTGGTELGNQAIVGLGTFRRDSVAPAASVPTFNPASPSAARSITVQASATDDRSGVQRIEVSANGALVGTIAGASGSVAWNAEALPDGDYTIRARAFDQAGNSHDATAVYTLDRAAPDTFASLTPASPDGMNGWFVTPPTITLSTNAASGATIRYRVGDGAWTPYAGPFVVQPEGDQTVSFRTTSRSGVEGPLRSLRVKVDSSAPANPSLVDEDALTDSSSELNVTVANPDPQSGVWRMTYRVGTAPMDDSLWPETTVTTNGTFLNADGLFVPPGTTAFVSLKVQNAAGAWSDWSSTDGIVMDPREALHLLVQRVFASAGGPASDDTYTVDGTLGETAVGELLTDNADGLLLAGFWSGGAGRTLSVAVELQAFEADPTGLEIDVWVYEPGGVTPIAQYSMPLGLDGVVRVSTPLRGVHDVRIKASHWLARRLSGVEIGAPALAVSLPNGDITEDNAIDLDDFLVLAAAYETVVGDPAYDAAADLNGDEAVNLDDFLILAAGYETVGD